MKTPRTIELTMTLTEQPEGTDDDDAFFGTVQINGINHHITLIAVDEVAEDDGRCSEASQEGASYWGDRCLDAMRQFEDTSGAFSTIDVGNRHFVVCITPYLQ